MAVTCTDVQLADSLRLGYTLEELAEAARLLALVSVVVVKHAPTAPDVIHNEAAIRLASYLYDQPTAPRGDGYANALRNSGAARLLLPYRVHRAGFADAMSAAQRAVGTAENPVVGLSLAGGVLTILFADASTETITLQGGDGTDQTARDAAETAQEAAATAQTAINRHTMSHALASGVYDRLRLPAPAVVMRLGWSQSQVKVAAIFDRGNDHPIDGAAVGTTGGVTVPPFPPALNTDLTLYQWIWVEGDPTIAELRDTGLDLYQNEGALEVDSVAGTAYVSTGRLVPPIPSQPSIISILIDGDLIASQPWVTELIATHTAVVAAHHTPGGGDAKARYIISFPAASYSYLATASGGWDPGGTSRLTASYPAGLTQAILRAKIFYGVLQTDPADDVFGSRRLMTDWQQDLMLSDYADPQNRYIQVRLGASDIELILQGTQLAGALERDSWALFLTVI